MSKVAILAYADDKQNSLEWLDDELESIQDYFVTNNKGEVEVIPIANATLDRITAIFAARSDDIILFHFSGHADGAHLYFKDEKAARGNGLAEILGTAPELEFVFLNGCATKDHVDQLHTANIKAVIATARKVNDNLAANFSKTFYSGLCRHLSLSRSFSLAKGNTQSDNRVTQFGDNNSRHLGTTDISNTDEFPWGIYYKAVESEDKQSELSKEIEEWTLPEKGIGHDKRAMVDYKPCYDFIEHIADNIEGYYDQIKGDKNNTGLDESLDGEFKELKKYYNEDYDRDSYTFRHLSDRVKNMMPYPLATKLEKIIKIGKEIMDEIRNNIDPGDKYYDLLRCQIEFYLSLSKVCGLIMISDLYDFLIRKKNKNEVIITQGQYECVNGFFSITNENKDDFDYTAMLKSIREILEINGATPFIREYEVFKENFKHKKELFEAHMEITSLRYRLQSGKIDPSLIQSYCKKAETLLWQVFQKVYFILRYKLVVIRKIEIIKYRADKPLFVHNRVILHKSIDDFFPEADVDIIPTDGDLNKSIMDSSSVMLFRALSDFSSYLNLSPFAIDLNVLKGEENSLLYLFSHIDKANGLVYEEVQNPQINITINVGDSGRIEYVNQLSKPPKVKRKIAQRLTTLYRQFEILKSEIAALKEYARLEEEKNPILINMN